MGRFSDLNKGRINTYIESTSLEDLTISNEGILDVIEAFFDEFLSLFRNLTTKTVYGFVSSKNSSEDVLKEYKSKLEAKKEEKKDKSYDIRTNGEGEVVDLSSLHTSFTEVDKVWSELEEYLKTSITELTEGNKESEDVQKEFETKVEELTKLSNKLEKDSKVSGNIPNAITLCDAIISYNGSLKSKTDTLNDSVKKAVDNAKKIVDELKDLSDEVKKKRKDKINTIPKLSESLLKSINGFNLFKDECGKTIGELVKLVEEDKSSTEPEKKEESKQEEQPQQKESKTNDSSNEGETKVTNEGYNTLSEYNNQMNLYNAISEDLKKIEALRPLAYSNKRIKGQLINHITSLNKKYHLPIVKMSLESYTYNETISLEDGIDSIKDFLSKMMESIKKFFSDLFNKSTDPSSGPSSTNKVEEYKKWLEENKEKIKDKSYEVEIDLPKPTELEAKAQESSTSENKTEDSSSDSNKEESKESSSSEQSSSSSENKTTESKPATESYHYGLEDGEENKTEENKDSGTEEKKDENPGSITSDFPESEFKAIFEAGNQTCGDVNAKFNEWAEALIKGTKDAKAIEEESLAIMNKTKEAINKAIEKKSKFKLTADDAIKLCDAILDYNNKLSKEDSFNSKVWEGKIDEAAKRISGETEEAKLKEAKDKVKILSKIMQDLIKVVRDTVASKDRMSRAISNWIDQAKKDLGVTTAQETDKNPQVVAKARTEISKVTDEELQNLAEAAKKGKEGYLEGRNGEIYNNLVKLGYGSSFKEDGSEAPSLEQLKKIKEDVSKQAEENKFSNKGETKAVPLHNKDDGTAIKAADLPSKIDELFNKSKEILTQVTDYIKGLKGADAGKLKSDKSKEIADKIDEFLNKVAKAEPFYEKGKVLIANNGEANTLKTKVEEAEKNNKQAIDDAKKAYEEALKAVDAGNISAHLSPIKSRAGILTAFTPYTQFLESIKKAVGKYLSGGTNTSTEEYACEQDLQEAIVSMEAIFNPIGADDFAGRKFRPDSLVIFLRKLFHDYLPIQILRGLIDKFKLFLTDIRAAGSNIVELPIDLNLGKEFEINCPHVKEWYYSNNEVITIDDVIKQTENTIKLTNPDGPIVTGLYKLLGCYSLNAKSLDGDVFNLKHYQPFASAGIIQPTATIDGFRKLTFDNNRAEKLTGCDTRTVRVFYNLITEAANPSVIDKLTDKVDNFKINLSTPDPNFAAVLKEFCKYWTKEVVQIRYNLVRNSIWLLFRYIRTIQKNS